MMSSPDQPDSYWDLLGVDVDADPRELDQAYVRARGHSDDHELLRRAWKVLRDPFYAATYAAYRSETVLAAAGFFDNRVEPEQLGHSPGRWLTTPVHKLTANLNRAPAADPARGYAVLLSTGAFAPVHDGHLGMLEIARDQLERCGYRVLGGYLSPSHDHYVSTKFKDASDIAQRLHLCELACADSDWLMTDGWEGRYIATAVNFTDVIVRLQRYLAAHVAVPVTVFYVFGDDNAGFARAFVGQGGCVCVPRPGIHPAGDELFAEPAVHANERILLAKRSTVDVSSTAVRAGAGQVPQPVARQLRRWKTGESRGTSIYAVRDDVGWALQPWFARDRAGTRSLDAAREEFVAGLRRILSDALEPATDGQSQPETQVTLIGSERQQRCLDRLTAQGRVLNLDVIGGGQAQLGVSREFAVSDGQGRCIGLGPRPGTPPLASQLDRVPDGSYTLVDDDIATGQTRQWLLDQLPDRIQVSDSKALLDCWRRKHDQTAPVWDVVDARDFLLGGRDAGLVVQLPDTNIARAPYMLPYVCLPARAKLPPSRAFPCSLRLWQLNRRLFARMPSPLRVSDADPACRALLRYLGFAAEDPLAEVCDWHIQQLEAQPFSPDGSRP
jgi:nicotinic acid mononucleotide adenylyltransferase